MKTVKFKDLPEKVQEFCKRLGYAWIGNIVDTEWLHTKADWSKATPSERLAYAQWKYPKGTEYNPVFKLSNNDVYISNGQFTLDIMAIYNSECSALFYSTTKGWASIISEPEKEEEIIEEFVNDYANRMTELGSKFKTKPTFKAGDEVEYYCIAEEKYLPAIYAFRIEGTNWLYTDGNKKDGFNMRCAWSFPDNVLRKPDPDKVYREMAKEMIKGTSYISTDSCANKCYLESTLIEMLIEALKKGKEL